MHGPADAVLYVGKAKSLRHRLGSYRVANPDRMARRTLRLLRLVERIAWEECADESAALHRESELLLSLKPRFNRAGVWQGPKRFLAWREQPHGLELAILDSASDEWQCAGPFGAQAVHLLRALVRLLWCGWHPESGLAGMPSGWFRGEHGSTVTLSHTDAGLTTTTAARLSCLASGDVESFSVWLPPVAATFEQSVREEDLELVTKHLAGRLW